jgi:hypothetical protein
MPKLGPIKRRDLIAGLTRLGFTGPYSGGNHQFMKRGALKLRIPNPHQSDITRATSLCRCSGASSSRPESARPNGNRSKVIYASSRQSGENRKETSSLGQLAVASAKDDLDAPRLKRF